MFISGGGVKILVDAGLSAKKIITALKAINEEATDLNAILITHEHIDHIRGAGILARKLGIPIYANQKTWKAMEQLLGSIGESQRQYFTTGGAFKIGDLNVTSFATPHDAAESTGFCFHYQDKKVSIATDIGHITETIMNSLKQSNLIILESNHDLQMLKNGSYPYYLKQRIMGERGHLSNDAAGELVGALAETGTTHFVLGHLSRENNRPELAFQTVSRVLTTRGIKVGDDVQLAVAMRDTVGEVVNL